MTNATDLILFCASDGTRFQVCTVTLSGSGFRQLTSDTHDYNWARWSPDGTKILATGGSFATPELYVMNADGSGVRQITNIASTGSSLNFYQGDWSPDGSQVVVLGPTTGSGGSSKADLQIVNVDNSGYTVVTLTRKMALWANAPVNWSPDGTKFLFPTMAGDFGTPGYGILSATVCNIDGSGEVDLLTADGTVILGYLPWRWYPDSTNILVIKHPFSGNDSLLKSDGATTATIYTGPSLNLEAGLGAMNSDGSAIVFNNQSSTGINKLVAGTVATAYAATVSSDGVDYKTVEPVAQPLTPGVVTAGRAQSGILRDGVRSRPLITRW